MPFNAARSKQGLLLSMSVLLSCAPLLTQAAWCQALSRPGQHVAPAAAGSTASSSFDLGATDATVASKNTQPVTVLVGGNSQHGTVTGGTALTVLPGQLITPAQNAAVYEVLHGQQTLLLGAQGAALGGSARINSRYAQDFSNIVVPGGVTLAAIGYNKNTPLNVSGALDISGAMHLLQNASNITAMLNLGSLNIHSGGVLSTDLPANMNTAGLFSSSGMSLNVVGNVVNQGTISTQGDLTISAANIANQSVNGVLASVLAQNINLISSAGSVVNSGLMSATNNINLSTLNPSTDLIINNTNGVMSALNSINIRDTSYVNSANTNFIGGDWLSNELTINCGSGTVIGDVNKMTGLVNMNGGFADLTVHTDQWRLGNISLQTDPILANNSGDILLSGDIVTFGGDLMIVASGNIGIDPSYTSASADLINTGSIGLRSGNVFLIAGATVGGDVGNTTPNPMNQGSVNIVSGKTVTVTAGTGGSIDLTGVQGKGLTNLIDTRSGLDGAAGGSVTMVAYGGSLSLPALPIRTGGAGAGANGNVLLMANKIVQSSNAIIDTTGGSGAGGDIYVYNASPTSAITVQGTNDSAGISSQMTVATTAGTALKFSDGSSTYFLEANPTYDTNNGSFVFLNDLKSAGTIKASAQTDIVLGQLTTNSGSVDVSTTHAITTGDIKTSGGAVNLSSTGTKVSDAIQVNSIDSSGAVGGKVDVSGGFSFSTLGNLVTSGSAGNGGSLSVQLSSDAAAISVLGGIDSSASGGTGGSITLKAGGANTTLRVDSGIKTSGSVDAGNVYVEINNASSPLFLNGDSSGSTTNRLGPIVSDGPAGSSQTVFLINTGGSIQLGTSGKAVDTIGSVTLTAADSIVAGAATLRSTNTTNGVNLVAENSIGAKGSPIVISSHHLNASVNKGSIYVQDNGGQALTVDSALAQSDISLTAASLVVGGFISSASAGTITLSSTGDISRTSAFPITTTGSLVLISSSGSVGKSTASFDDIVTSAGKLSISAAGSVYVFNNGSTTLEGVNSAGSDYNLQVAAGGITVTDPLHAAGAISLSADTNMTINGSIDAQAAVSLTVNSGVLSNNATISSVSGNLKISSNSSLEIDSLGTVDTSGNTNIVFPSGGNLKLGAGKTYSFVKNNALDISSTGLLTVNIIGGPGMVDFPSTGSLNFTDTNGSGFLFTGASGSTISTAGNLTITSSGTVTIDSGITLASAGTQTLTLNRGGLSNNGSLVSGAGVQNAISILSNGGIKFSGNGIYDVSAGSSGSILVQSPGAIIMGDSIGFADGTVFNITGGKDFVFRGTQTTFSLLLAGSNSNVYFKGGGLVTIRNDFAAGTGLVATNGTFNFDGPVQFAGSSASLSIATQTTILSAGQISFSTAVVDNGGTIKSTSGIANNVFFDIQSSMVLRSAGSIDVNSGSGSVLFNSTGNGVLLFQPNMNQTIVGNRDVSFISSGNLDFKNQGGNHAFIGTGNYVVQAGGDISFSRQAGTNLKFGGPLSVTPGVGKNITINNSVKVTGASTMTFNLDGGTFTNNGTITSLLDTGVGIEVSSANSLALGGAGTLDVSTGTACTALIQANDLTLNNGLNQTMLGTTALTISAHTINLASGVTAQFSGSSASFNVVGSSGLNLLLDPSSTLNFAGNLNISANAPIVFAATSAGNSAAGTISSGGLIDVQTNGALFTDYGTLKTTTDSAYNITVESTGTLSLAGTGVFDIGGVSSSVLLLAQNGNFDLSGGSSFLVNSGRNLDFKSNLADLTVNILGAQNSTVSFPGTGVVYVTGSNILLNQANTGGKLSVGGSAYLQGVQSVTLTGLTLSAAHIQLVNTSSTGSVSGTGIFSSDDITFAVYGDVDVNTADNSSLNLTMNNANPSQTVRITNTGNLNLYSFVSTAGNLVLLNTGDLTLSSPLSAGQGLSIFLSAGNELINNGNQIAAGIAISLRMDTYDLTGANPLSAPSNVYIDTVTPNQIITLGTVGGGLHLTEAQINAISTASLQIGSNNQVGGINVNSNLNLTTGLDLFQGAGGSFTSVGKSITVSGAAGNAFGVTLDSGNISVGSITNTADTGRVTLQTNGTSSVITLDGTANLPTAHVLQILAGTGSIANLPGSAGTTISVNSSVIHRDSAGNGGSIFLSGSNLTTRAWVLDASGASTGGDGGTASWISSDKNAFSARQSTLSINVSGDNAGKAVVISGGALTVDVGAGVLNTVAKSGRGADIILRSGTQTAGNLLITGSLSSDGSSAGNGGNITLISNSSTAFTFGVGSSKNGITGTLSLAKGNSGSQNGDLEVDNFGGGITYGTSSISGFENLTFDASLAKSGPITISKALGNSTTNAINLRAGGTGAVTLGTSAITARNLFMSSLTGAISGSKLFISENLSAEMTASSGTAGVTLVNSASSFTVQNVIALGAVSITNTGSAGFGDTLVQGLVKAGSNVTIKNSAADGSVVVSNSIVANSKTGTVSITATGIGKIRTTSNSTSIIGKTINLTTGSSAGVSIGEGNTLSGPGALLVQAESIALNTTGLVNINNLGASSGAPLTVTATKSASTFTLSSASALVLNAAMPSVTELRVLALGKSLTVTGSVGGSSATSKTTFISLTADSIIGAGVLTTNASGSIVLDSAAGIGSKSALKVNTPSLNVPTVSSGLINIASLASAVLVNSNLSASGAITFASSGTSMLKDITGSAINISSAGNLTAGHFTASTGAITASTSKGALTLGVLEAGSSIKLTSAADLGTGIITAHENSAQAIGTITVSAKGQVFLGDLSTDATGNNGLVSITQTAVGDAGFGRLTGSDIKLSLKPAGGNAVTNFATLGATSGSVSITESGATNASHMLNVTGSIVAAKSVSITTIGTTLLSSISSSSGNTTISTKADTTLSGAITALGTAASVSVTQAGGNALAIAGISAVGNVTVTSSGGANATGIIVSGDIGSGGNVIVQSKAVNSGIQINSAVSSDATKGSVTVSANGSGNIITNGSGMISGKIISLNSGSGTLGTGSAALGAIILSAPNIPNSAATSVSLNSKGLANINYTASFPMVLASATTSNVLTLRSSADVTLNSPVSTATAISVDTSAGNGVINVNGATLGGASTLTLDLKTGGGSIIGKGILTASSPGSSISLTSASGNFGTSLTNGLKINTTSLTSATTTGFVNLINSNNLATGASYGVISGSSVTVSSANKSFFNGDITTGGGSGNISLISTSGLLTVGAGSAVHLHASGTSAQILIQEKANTNTAGINIANSSLIESDATDKSDFLFPLAGQISFIIGATIPSPSGPNTHSGFSISGMSATQAFFGTNPAKVVSAATTNLIINGNTAVQFQAGTVAQITLSAATVDADPPAPTAAISSQLMPTHQSSTAVLGAGSRIPSANGLTSNSFTDAPAIFQPSNSTDVLLNDHGLSTSSTSIIQSASRGFQSVLGAGILNANSTYTAPHAKFDSQSSSSVMERSSFLQGTVSSNESEESSFADSSLSSLIGTSTKASNFGSSSEHSPSWAIISNSHRAENLTNSEVLELAHGKMLLAPQHKTNIKTPFGTVLVGAHSLVALVSSRDGLSVFNLDDNHRDAVGVECGAAKYHVAPGKHLTLTHSFINRFEDVNPLDEISYRNLKVFSPDAKTRVFSAEFSIPSALNAISPLRILLNSGSSESAKLKQHMMKTVASILQLNKSGERYQQMPRSKMAAFNQ